MKNMPKRKRRKKIKDPVGQAFVDVTFGISVLAVVFSFLVVATGANYEILSPLTISRESRVMPVLAEKNNLEESAEKVVQVAEKEDVDQIYLNEVQDLFQGFTDAGSISVGYSEGDVLINGIGFYDDGFVDVFYRGGTNQYIAKGVLAEENNPSELKSIFIVAKNNLKY